MHMEFKDRLRAAIRTAGITQIEAAELIGCSQKMVGHWLLGAEPRRPMYEKILAAFPDLREKIAS